MVPELTHHMRPELTMNQEMSEGNMNNREILTEESKAKVSQ